MERSRNKAHRASGRGRDRDQARELHERGCQVDGIVHIQDRRVVGGQFRRLRPRRLKRGHSWKRAEAKNQLLQVVVRADMRELVSQRDLKLIRAEKLDS